MSDYLGHLLERSFAPTPAVRPQIPSLFEPKPAAEQTGLRLDSSETNHGETGERPATKGKETSPAKPLNDSASQMTDKITPVIQEMRPTEMTAEENPKSSNSATATKKARIAPLVASIGASAVPNDEPASSFPHGPVHSTVVKKNPNTDESLPGKSKEPVTSEFATRRPQTEREVVVDFHIDDSERRYGDRRPADVTRNLQPRAASIAPRDITPTSAAKSPTLPLAARVSPREKPDTRDERHAEETTQMPPQIHVTIGRVEIRAHTPPPAIVRSAPRKESGLSLENYLQRRAGGGSS